MSKSEENYLWLRLRQNRDRLQRIADEEARGAIIRSGAADGRFEKERERLIEQAEKILVKLEASYGKD